MKLIEIRAALSAVFRPARNGNMQLLDQSVEQLREQRLKAEARARSKTPQSIENIIEQMAGDL